MLGWGSESIAPSTAPFRAGERWCVMLYWCRLRGRLLRPLQRLPAQVSPKTLSGTLLNLEADEVFSPLLPQHISFDFSICHSLDQVVLEGFPPSQKMDIRLIFMFSLTGHRDFPWKSEASIFMVIFCLQNFLVSKVLCLKFQTGKNCWQTGSLGF